MTELISSPAAPPANAGGGPVKVGRITSLDWVRGWFLCGSVATVSLLAPRPDSLRHTAWIGVTVEDLIFPLFVTLSGCGLAFAYRNSVGWGATLRRSLILLVCGLTYNAVAAGTFDVATLQWTGPLQVYAVLVLLIGLLHFVARAPLAWAAITAVIALVQLGFLFLWQSGCPGAQLTPECNPSRTIDTYLLGAEHIYHRGLLGHDPEGVMGILGALLTACAGATAGHLALSSRGTRRGPGLLVAWAVTVALGAIGAAQLLPTMKRLWTTPFALGAAAIAILVLAIAMALLDLPAGRRWQKIRERIAWPHLALGRNSLLVYFGSHLLILVLLTRGGDPSWALRMAGAVDVVGHPRASLVVTMVLGWAILAAILHQRRIYLRP